MKRLLIGAALVLLLALAGCAGAAPDNEALGQAVLHNERIGGIYLGMPEAELVALYGQPTSTSNSGPVTDEAGVQHLNYNYKLPGSGQLYLHDLNIELADQGEGWFVNGIFVLPECPATVATAAGIGIGSSREAVEAAYGEQLNPIYSEQVGDPNLVIGWPEAGLYIVFDEHDRVQNLDFGLLVAWPPEELDDEK